DVDRAAFLGGRGSIPTESGLGISRNSFPAEIGAGHVDLGAKVSTDCRPVQQRNRLGKILGNASSLEIHAPKFCHGTGHSFFGRRRYPPHRLRVAEGGANAVQIADAKHPLSYAVSRLGLLPQLSNVCHSAAMVSGTETREAVLLLTLSCTTL